MTDHAIEGIERRNRFALVEFDHLPGGAILFKERTEDAEMQDLFMLQNENMHGQSLLALDCRSHRAGSRVKPYTLEVMPILAGKLEIPPRGCGQKVAPLRLPLSIPPDAVLE